MYSEKMPRLKGIYPAIPETFVCAPDDESRIEELQTEYFDGLLHGLGYISNDARRSFCEVRLRHLLREGVVPAAGDETNDSVAELLIQDRAVATVMKLRTGYNFTQAVFGFYITPELEALVQFKGIV